MDTAQHLLTNHAIQGGAARLGLIGTHHHPQVRRELLGHLHGNAARARIISLCPIKRCPEIGTTGPAFQAGVGGLIMNR